MRVRGDIVSDQASALTRVVLATPFHRYCSLELVSQEPGAAVCRIPVDDATANVNGVLHGGIVHAFIDVAAFLGLVPLFGPGETAVTHDIHVSVLKPAPRGSIVEFRSRVLRRGKNVAFIRTDAYAITGQGESYVATGTVTKSFVRYG